MNLNNILIFAHVLNGIFAPTSSIKIEHLTLQSLVVNISTASIDIKNLHFAQQIYHWCLSKDDCNGKLVACKLVLRWNLNFTDI